MSAGGGSQQTLDELRALVLPATAADGIAIRKVLDANGIGCVVVRNVAAIGEAMGGGVGTIVIAEEALVADSEQLLACIRGQEVWSDLPVIVLSLAGREPVDLAAIVPHGNFSVIERPVRASTLVSLIRSNLRARGRQYQVREHMARQEAAQRLIGEAEQRFRLVENITDYAIFMIDVEGRVASWNSGAQHLLGYTAQEILGQPTATFFEDDGATLAREIVEARLTGRATSTGWRRRGDAERLYVEGVLTAVRDDEGRLLGYSKLMKDITEKRRTEIEREHLLQSERAARTEAERSGHMKDEFLATLGHELRTPLNAILGWAQVLGQGSGVSAALRDGLRVIERNARAQAQIIEDLLDMSSIISGRVRLEILRIDLATIVSASIEGVRPAAAAKGIDLRVELERTEEAISGDPNRLQQVFWNLLTNAVKFTPRGGHISVSLQRESSQLKVSVADSGEGIDPTFLPHVFERFRQADASTSRHHGGLGLGLSIVKQLVELHGGNIDAASEGSGKGATFTVALPLMAANAYPAERPERRGQRSRSVLQDELTVNGDYANLEGVKVLVVDDEPDARSLIERLLQDCEATVTTAGSASEAMEHVARDKPDVLLSDIGMPTEDGYTLIRRIRKLAGENGRIPAIALTAYARAEDRTKAMQAGYQNHLPKPIDPIKLIAMVASLVKPAHH